MDTREAAALLVAFCFIVAGAADLLPWRIPAVGALIWVVSGYGVVGAVANAATPSRWERRIWLPVVILILAASVVVAIG